MKVKSLSRVQLFVTPWTVAHQAPPSLGFSRQEYWSGLPFPSPGDLSDPGIKPRSPALQADALTSEPPGKPYKLLYLLYMKKLSLNINLVFRSNLSDLFILFFVYSYFFFTLLFISVFQVNICNIRNNDHTRLFIPKVYFLLCFASFLKNTLIVMMYCCLDCGH